MTNVDKALLLAEWSSGTLGMTSGCPVCGGTRHLPSCALDLALSERGYCSRDERDRGRKFAASFAPTLPPPDPEEQP